MANIVGGGMGSPHLSRYKETHDDPSCPSNFVLAPDNPPIQVHDLVFVEEIIDTQYEVEKFSSKFVRRIFRLFHTKNFIKQKL